MDARLSDKVLSNQDLVRHLLSQSSDATGLLSISKAVRDGEPCSRQYERWSFQGCPSDGGECLRAIGGLDSTFCQGTYDARAKRGLRVGAGGGERARFFCTQPSMSTRRRAPFRKRSPEAVSFGMAHLEALLTQHGPRGLVHHVKLAAEHQLEYRAALFIGAIVTIPTKAIAQRLAAHRAKGAEVLVNVLHAFPESFVIAQGALVALNKVWEAGLSPFDAAFVPTERVVTAVLDVMAKHKADLLATQAGLRLLSLHARSRTQLLKLPQVMEALEVATCSYPNDDTVQSYAAETVISINCIEPSGAINAHGQLGYAAVCEATVRLCLSTRRPSMQLGGVDWQEKVMLLFPRMRERA